MLANIKWYLINKIVQISRSFLLLVLLQIISHSVFAQKEIDYPFGDNFQFDVLMTNRATMITEPVYVPINDNSIYQIFDKLQKTNKAVYTPKSPILLGVKLNPLLIQYYANSVQSISKDYQTFIIADSSQAVLIAMGINPENISDYKYHVVENDSSEIVPWSPIPGLEQNYGAKQPYGFIGKFKAPGHWLMVEVVNTKNYGIREGVIFDWRVSFKPVLSEIMLGTPSGYFNIGYPKINRGYATTFNKLGVPSDLHFYADSVSWISIQLKRQETLVHSAYLIKMANGRKDTSDRLGFVDRYGFFQLDRSSFAAPGHYELIIKKQERQVVWNEPDMLRIPFYVLPPPNGANQFSFKQLLLVSSAIAALFIIYVIYQKQKLKKTQQQEATMQLKLKSLRSQLNPHFMFNALSSIQNLVNKNEMLKANLYLAKFAGLTRKVLNSTQQEMISLEEELKITDDYLQIEQLRFGFEYRIEADPSLSQSNIDIPAMLLQPFIENAVKHGIAMLNRSGLILVSIAADGHNFVLSVEDNGKGFDTGKIRSGDSFGLKLSEERISLLNQIYKHQPAKLIISSRPGQTIVSITLTNWI
jgi:two-component system, LytTR family, sensor kinase